MCALVWCFALIGSIPQFIFSREVPAGTVKKECATAFPKPDINTPWIVYSFRFLLGFVIPFFVITVCHWKVYRRAESGFSRGNRSKRTLKIIVGVIICFFFCWIPLHVVDFILLDTARHHNHRPKVVLAHTLALCLAYANSCLNPLLYVCLGRGFKNRVNKSIRGILNFATEEQHTKISVHTNESRSTSLKEMTKI